jgi:hypothetical protein
MCRARSDQAGGNDEDHQARDEGEHKEAGENHACARKRESPKRHLHLPRIAATPDHDTDHRRLPLLIP